MCGGTGDEGVYKCCPDLSYAKSRSIDAVRQMWAGEFHR